MKTVHTPLRVLDRFTTLATGGVISLGGRCGGLIASSSMKVNWVLRRCSGVLILREWIPPPHRVLLHSMNGKRQ